MDLDQKLTYHFTLREMVYTAHRSIDNTPTQEIVNTLRKTAVELLEPIREKFGPVVVNSGYRCPKLNKAIKGAKRSAHIYGAAADLNILSMDGKFQEVVNWIVEQDLPYDQLILESSSTSNWIHIGGEHFKYGIRKQVLRFDKGKYTIYNPNIKYGV